MARTEHTGRSKAGRKPKGEKPRPQAPQSAVSTGFAAADWPLPVFVSVETEAQLSEVLQQGAVRRIYIDEACFPHLSDSMRRIHAAGKEAGLRLRRIMRDLDAVGREEPGVGSVLQSLLREEASGAAPDAVLLRSLDEAMELVTLFPEPGRFVRSFDYTMYGYNREAAAALQSLGADSLTFPIELTAVECRRLQRRCLHQQTPERYPAELGSAPEGLKSGYLGPISGQCGRLSEQPAEGLKSGFFGPISGQCSTPYELLVYGHLPMMVSANCLQKTSARCDHQNRVLPLRDRMGKSMPVRCYCRFCYNQIYNADPLVLYDLPEEALALQPQYIRYDFSVESAETVRKVLSGTVPPQLTRGHFRHGIE